MEFEFICTYLISSRCVDGSIKIFQAGFYNRYIRLIGFIAIPYGPVALTLVNVSSDYFTAEFNISDTSMYLFIVSFSLSEWKTYPIHFFHLRKKKFWFFSFSFIHLLNDSVDCPFIYLMLFWHSCDIFNDDCLGTFFFESFSFHLHANISNVCV